MATKPVPATADSVFPDPWMTKAQIRATYSVTNDEIKALTALGYLNPIRLGPRMKRYRRDDVRAGINAFLADSPPPAPTTQNPSKIDWEI